MLNKRGSSVTFGFVLIFVALLGAIFLGIVVYAFNVVNDTISQDVDIGQVNLKEVSDATFGQINTGIKDQADTIGILMLLGMCLLMIINGYFTAGKFPKLFFVIDIFLLALFFIPAIYVSQIYLTFINSTTVFSDTFINIIPKTSKFVLNLPLIVSTVGVLTMIVSYAGLRRERTTGEETNVLGF